ncbi:hypothetical protein [Nocardia gipuzkoensis]|uniref:hypothetical protein n=1 Tax=Nocardia gipuzkoensis TaxID=2749991 RepID=UPI00237E57CC|nr:hypothetical protein [Nocardia gipuzkoensis]MDE1673816.1 hypothetical protein [Nocardia gipuzkoensis]
MTDMYGVITITWVALDGRNMTSSWMGVVRPTAGDTRQSLFKLVFDVALKQFQVPSDAKPAILFFSLEPNHVGGP